jgi:hypothetical protein
MNERNIRLTLTPQEFLVINEFLYRVRLGNRNQFEEAVSELMILLEEGGSDEFAARAATEYGVPSIGVEFSDDEGLVFNISE